MSRGFKHQRAPSQVRGLQLTSGIRGQASREETEALLEEGIAVLPLPLPEGLKGPLQ